MRKNVLFLAIFVVLIGIFLQVSPTYAQATRTWVSGVGDDANPCSRTAPCKTFAGAISKTAAGGEINVLDPGGFGGVTITKSITISSEGFEAGVLVSGTNAIIINAAATDQVVLRGLDIEGLGTGLVGIKVLGGLAALHVEKCTINNFRGSNGSGIEVAPTLAGTMQLFVKDTIIRRNGSTGGTGGGVLLHPGAGVTVKGSFDNVRMEFNNFGLRAESRVNLLVKNSISSGNGFAGFSAIQVGGGNAINLTLDHCSSTNNGSVGLVTNGDNVTVARVISSSIIANASNGVLAQGTSQIISAGNNFVDGNSPNGTFTSTPGTQ
jgi:hypothetical protein